MYEYKILAKETVFTNIARGEDVLVNDLRSSVYKDMEVGYLTINQINEYIKSPDAMFIKRTVVAEA